jgi:hypothetical protein
MTFENDARDAIASTSSTSKSIESTTNIEVATIHERELCVIKNVLTKDRKRLKSR